MGLNVFVLIMLIYLWGEIVDISIAYVRLCASKSKYDI